MKNDESKITQDKLMTIQDVDIVAGHEYEAKLPFFFFQKRLLLTIV